jgi:DNA-directed RNA polymerase subunit RPC12/RpoP
MKEKPGRGGFAKPSGKQRRLFKCGNCGGIFTEARILPLLPVKCPYCGSFKTAEDKRVVY